MDNRTILKCLEFFWDVPVVAIGAMSRDAQFKATLKNPTSMAINRIYPMVLFVQYLYFRVLKCPMIIFHIIPTDSKEFYEYAKGSKKNTEGPEWIWIFNRSAATRRLPPQNPRN